MEIEFKLNGSSKMLENTRKEEKKRSNYEVIGRI